MRKPIQILRRTWQDDDDEERKSRNREFYNFMILTADDLNAQLERLFPAFRSRLTDSVFVEQDGRCTPHGLCAEFSHFYRDHIADFGLNEKIEFFCLVESVVLSNPDVRHPLANALCTCFLENIACSEAGEVSQPLMGPRSRAYFDPWHVRRPANDSVRS